MGKGSGGNSGCERGTGGMHILLTDVLACPRCGPEFGLVLLADRLEARRVVDGSLGCANCRERYPVRGGIADLRPGVGASTGAPSPGMTPSPPVAAGAADAAEALRLAALLGLTEGAGIVLLAGSVARLAGALGQRLENVEVVAAQGTAGAAQPTGDAASVSRIVVSDRLPFGTKALRGVALTGATAEVLLDEAARVLAPMHRLVLEEAFPEARARVEALGLEVLAEEGGALVALKREAPDPPKLHQLV